MSVAGIDFGNCNCLVATAGRGGVDVVLNESSNRLNKTYVSFGDTQRHMGAAAESVARSNYRNTAMNLKHLVGRRFEELDLAFEQQFLGPELVEVADGTVGLRVSYGSEELVLRPEQVIGSMIGHMTRVCGSSNKGILPRYLTVSVPHYYTDLQRRAMMNACAVADVNCVKLVNEATATALHYGIFKSAKKEFQDEEDTHVLFLDMGESDFTASVVSFRNGELRVRSSASDRTLGGRLFDLAIAKKICAEFKEKHRNLSGDPEADRKTFFKVLGAAEKAKKTISPHGVSEAAVFIEFLMDDFDYAGRLTLEDFEAMAQPLVERIDAPIEQALREAGLTAEQLHSVEMVGGATRVPCVKRRFEQVLGASCVRITTTMNADESVARGAALACALSSPVFRSMPFGVKDVVAFPVRVHWEGAGPSAAENDGEEEEEDEAGAEAAPAAGAGSAMLLQRGGLQGAPKKLMLRREAGFSLSATYDESASSAEGGGLPARALQSLATFHVSGLPESVEGRAKVKLLLGTDDSGIVRLRKATLMEELPPEESAAGAEGAEAAGEEGAKGEETMDVEGKEGEAPKKKRRFRKRDLDVAEAVDAGMDAAALSSAVEVEADMMRRDEAVRAKEKSRNDLEAYIYSMRDRLLEELKPYVPEGDASAFSSALQSMEDWLYGDEGYDTTKERYDAKLAELNALGDPIERRVWEHKHRDAAFAGLGALCAEYLEVANSTEDRLAHIGEDDRATLRAEANGAQAWLFDMQGAQGNQPLDRDPVVTVAQLETRTQELRKVCKPIAEKPKPKPKAAEKPAEDAPAEDAKADAAEEPAADAAAEGAAAEGAEGEPMDTAK